MKYRILGKSNLEISEISFGCMSLTNDFSKNKALLQHAFNNGINFFDTADLYDNGQNEIMLGKAVKKVRAKVLIATKVGNQLNNDGKGWSWNPSKKYILGAVENSLKRLQTDYIDLYQLHGGTIEDPIDDTIEAFEILKQQGKILYYGISSIRPNVIRKYIEKSNIVSVMMQYSLLDRRPQETCLDLLKKNNVGVLARGTLAKGLLADKKASSYLDYDLATVNLAQKAILQVSRRKRSNAQTALHFVLYNKAITSAVCGIRTMQQLEDCLTTIDTNVLAAEEQVILENSFLKNTYNSHR